MFSFYIRCSLWWKGTQEETRERGDAPPRALLLFSPSGLLYHEVRNDVLPLAEVILRQPQGMWWLAPTLGNLKPAHQLVFFFFPQAELGQILKQLGCQANLKHDRKQILAC